MGGLFKTQYSTGETWEFIGGIILKNGQYYQMATPEGRAIFSSGAWQYEFDYKDHLGNTRVSFKANGNNLEKNSETAFDPFGVRLPIGVNNAFQNRFEMQGKESEKTFGLNRINLGARTVNPTIGRMDRVDAMAEKFLIFTPYNYTLNNPLKFIDPDGNYIIIYTQDGTALIYRNRQLYTQDAETKKNILYKGKDEFATKTQGILNKLYDIKDKEVTKTLTTLETSKNIHTIQKQKYEEQGNEVISNKPYLSNDGIPTGSNLYFKSGQVLKNEDNTDEASMAHELNHSYDYDVGDMKGESQIKSSAKDPAEIRSVNFENRVRYRMGTKLRTSYNGVKINKKDPKK